MFVCLYSFYDLNFKITMIYFGFEIVNFIIYPIYRIKTCYLQLEWSSFKTTSNKICASILRMIMSLLKTPFCTGIGQVCSSVYQFISVSIFFKLNYDVAKTGEVTPKKLIIKTKYIIGNKLLERNIDGTHNDDIKMDKMY